MTNEKRVMLGILTITIALLGVFALSSKPKLTTNSTKQQSVDTSGAWASGPENAPVTIVEFADFQCPACGKTYPVLEQVLKEYDGKIRFIHRHFPIESVHPHARLAAEASEAAGAQGKFWEMHELLFEGQDRWSSTNDPLPFFEQYAQSLGLNLNEFKSFIKEKKGEVAINRDADEGEKLGVKATPTLFINGKGISGAPSYSELKTIIEQGLKVASPS